MADGYRIEKDSLGEMQVPEEALYGAQTQRAVENFPISGQRFGRRFIEALGLIKKSAAQTNLELGNLDADIAEAIAQQIKRHHANENGQSRKYHGMWGRLHERPGIV